MAGDIAKGGPGRLVLVGTPIGNRGDISPRALDALREADTVLAEDTRVSGKLLASFGVEARLERCDENVIAERAPSLVARMAAGERMALVSDAGMPAVADPGARLVDACRDAGVAVDVVPGPSAVTCAIAQAGFPCGAFYFGGFLPRKDGERDRLLQSLAALPAVLVFYESPHRVGASLAAVARVFPGRRAALARELTKMYQEVVRAPAAELAERFAGDAEPKGECVLLVEPPGEEELEQTRRRMAIASLGAAPADDAGGFDLDAAIRAGLAAGRRTKDLAKELSACCGLSRGEVYDRVCAIAKG